MIILDVPSTLMQHQPDPPVVDGLDAQPAETIWITSITLFEARYGLALLPAVNDEQLARPKLGARIAARFADLGLAEPLPELHNETIETLGFDRPSIPMSMD